MYTEATIFKEYNQVHIAGTESPITYMLEERRTY